MTVERRIRRNTVGKVVGEVATRSGGFLFYFLLARWLGADAFGRYSLAVSYATLFAVLVDLGTNVIVTREIARRPGQFGEMVSRVNGFKLASAALFFLVLALSLPLSPGGRQGAGLVLAAGVIVAASLLLDSLHAIMSGLERMGVEALSKAVCKAALLAGAAAGYLATHSLAGVVTGVLLGSMAGLVVAYLLLMRLGAPAAVRWEGAWNRNLLAHSLPLVVSWVFWNFYDNQDVVLLGYLGLPAAAIGHFAAAMKLIDTLRGVPVLIGGALFPLLSAGAAADREHFARLAALLLRTVLSAALPIALGTAFLASAIVGAVYGPGFEPAAAALRVAAWAILGIFVNHALINLLVALDLQRLTILGAAGAAVVNLVALLVLTPRFDLPGAAGALVLSECAFLGINLWVMRGRAGGLLRPLAVESLRPLAAAALMGLCLYWAVPAWAPAAAGAAGVAVYVIALVAFGGVPGLLRGGDAS